MWLLLILLAIGQFSLISVASDFQIAAKTNFGSHLEGKLVKAIGEREVYYVQNTTLRPFPDFETFTLMNFHSKDILHIVKSELAEIPLGSSFSTLIGKSKEQIDQEVSTLNLVHELHRLRHQGHLEQHEPATFEEIKIEHSSIQIEKLTKLRQALDHHITACFNNECVDSDLSKGKWDSVLDNTPVIAYPMCFKTFNLGNNLGHYFNALACANLTGAHFVTVKNSFDIVEPEALVTKGSDRLAFLHSLTEVFVNPRPLSMGAAKEKVREICSCSRVPWEANNLPWFSSMELIGRVFRRAADEYLKGVDVLAGTTLSAGDLSSHPPSDYYPIVPNVTIQYRCGDNVGFSKLRYGLLPFRAIVSRIPSHSRYIYVVADSPTRSVGPYSGRCGSILQALFARLTRSFPSAVVLVKRGGDIFLDLARLVKAQVTICSSSTFCFWPAVSTLGSSHFPMSGLITGGYSNESLPYFTPNFHWIQEVEIITTFNHYKPWFRLIDDLDAAA